MSLPLNSRCPVCSAKEKLLRCQGCKVVHYCGKEHQTVHRIEHKSKCNKVKKSQLNLEKEERELRAQPGGAFGWPGATIFENQAGRFWGIHETRPYMRARYGLVESLLKIQTLPAVEAALGHIMELLRLCRSDNMGVRSHGPFLFLRLGKDQECYDFVKWWTICDPDGLYDWGDMTLPYCDIKDADVLEAVDPFTKQFGDIQHSVAVILIKIRLLTDLKMLQNSSILDSKVPAELLEEIRSHVDPIISKNKSIMNSTDQGPLIEIIELQIKQLFRHIDRRNTHFWPALLEPGHHLHARPEYTSRGDVGEMQLTLGYCYAAWVETPGAIDMIRKLRDNKN